MGTVNIEIQKPVSKKVVATTSLDLYDTAWVEMQTIFGEKAPRLNFDHDSNAIEKNPNLVLRGDFMIIEGKNRLRIREIIIPPGEEKSFGLDSPVEQTIYYFHVRHQEETSNP